MHTITTLMEIDFKTFVFGFSSFINIFTGYCMHIKAWRRQEIQTCINLGLKWERHPATMRRFVKEDSEIRRFISSAPRSTVNILDALLVQFYKVLITIFPFLCLLRMYKSLVVTWKMHQPEFADWIVFEIWSDDVKYNENLLVFKLA